MQATEIPTNTEDINLRLLHSLPESRKHTLTTLKQTVSLDVQDLDYIITKIESLVMDEQSRNLMTKKDIEQDVFKREKSLNHAFVSKETKETQDDGHFKGECFFAGSIDSASLGDFNEDSVKSEPPTPKAQIEI